MRKTLLLVIAVASVAAGCQAEGDIWQSMVLPTADVNQAFDAARHVLAEDYAIARATRDEGVIETQPLLIQKTGSDRVAGAYVSSGDIQTFRRIVRCRLHADEQGVIIRIAARLQREGTSQAEMLLLGSEGADTREAGAERRWRYLDPNRTTYWADIGRDAGSEADLLARIRLRIKSPTANPAP